MAERDSRGMIRTPLHLPCCPKGLNLTLPCHDISSAPPARKRTISEPSGWSSAHCQLKPSWYAQRVGGERLGIWKQDDAGG